MEVRKILFITTSSLASNPRLCKELSTLSKHYECHVISYYHADWSYELTKKIESSFPKVKFYTLDYRYKNFKQILFKLIHLFAIQLNFFFPNNLFIQALALNNKSFKLKFLTKKLSAKNNYDRIIAHNIGTFYPAYICLKKYAVDLQIDIEDYHPGEKTYFNHSREINNRMAIMQKVFNHALSVTYASKGIYLKCKESFKIPPSQTHEVILNSFFSSDFEYISLPSSKSINCVWYSQHISHGRGLEYIFEAAQKLDNITFHLIGNKNESYLSHFNIPKNIIFHAPMEQKELHQFLCTMDIGLALEDIKSDENRNICLTNKIISYAQAGLYIFATKTFGQNDFLNTLTYNAGEIISKDLLYSLSNFNHSILDEKSKRKEKAKSFSWEHESEKLLKLLN